MSKRYEREIDELLRAIGFPSRPRPSARQVWQQRLRRVLSGVRRPSSPGQVMLASFAMAAVGLFVSALSPSWGQVLGFGAVALFVIAFFTYFMRPGLRPPRRWRGRIVEDTSLPWGERLYRWLYRGRG